MFEERISPEQFKQLKTDLQGGNQEIKILSGSMMPILAVGSQYRLAPCDRKLLKKFDIIVFYAHEILIAHYVWHINKVIDENKIITRSLVSRFEDLPIPADNYLGKVVGVKIGWWRKFRIVLNAVFGRRHQ